MTTDFLPFLDPAAVRPFVEDDGDLRNLRFDYATIQSSMRRSDPCRLEVEYTRALMLFLLFMPAPSSILMIGLGGGSLPKYCHRYLPGARITVVEINPHVIALRDEFSVPPDDGRFKVMRGDGAQFLAKTRDRYDVIVVDGFHFNGPNAELETQEFLDRCRTVLHPGGVLAMNQDAEDAGNAAVLARINRSFGGGVIDMLVDGGTNRVVLAAQPALVAAVRMNAPLRLQELEAVHQETLKRRDSPRMPWPLLDGSLG